MFNIFQIIFFSINIFIWYINILSIQIIHLIVNRFISIPVNN